MNALALTGFARRMRVYLIEMYPVPERLALAVLIYVAIAAFASHIHHVPFDLASPATAVAIWSIFAMLLIVRLMDELKDKDIDRAMFRDRPLPSGRVRESDIIISLTAAIALYLVANLWSGSAFWVALFVLGYALLMFCHFFVLGVLRDSLLLTLATHNPLFPILVLYGFSMFAAQNGLAMTSLDWGLITAFVAMIWSSALGWEIARKIRTAAQEDDYVTYSRIFGRRGAVQICAGLQASSLCIGVYLYVWLSLSWIYITCFAAGFCVVAGCHFRFLVDPERGVAALRPAAEIFIFVVLITQVVGFADAGWWEFTR